MEPWTNEIKELYRIPGTYKEYRGYSSEELVFDGSNIVSGSVKITQSISDSEQLTYGNVEAAMLEMRLADSGELPISIVPPSPIQLATNTDQPVYTALPEKKAYVLRTDALKGAEVTLKQRVGEHEVPVGVFIIDEAKLEADTWFKKITAYDRLFKFRKDVSAWYNGLTFPLTMKQLRESLCAYIGVPFENVILPNDSEPIDKTVEPSVLTGLDVLRAVCELTACWAQMSPEGTLRWVALGVDSCETFDYELYDQTYHPDSTRADFESKAINAVVIRETEDDIGGHYPETLQDNPYIVQGNFLVYGKSTAELEAVAQAVMEVIGGKPYKPHVTLVSGRPYLQCGDKITIRTQKETFETYILKRVLTGEAAIKDSFEAQGKESVELDYDISRQIIQIKGKTNELTRTVDQTVSRVEDVEVGFSELEQYVDSITLSVTNGQTSSNIKLMAGSVELASEEIKFTGMVTFANLTDGVTQISGGNIKTGLVAAARIDVDNLYVKHLNGADGTFSGSLSAVTTNFNNLYCPINGGINIGGLAISYGNISSAGSLLMSSAPYDIIELRSQNYNISLYAGGDVQIPRLKSSTGATMVFGTTNGNLAYSGSSRRYKHDIQDADAAGYREIIERLSVKTFVMNNDEFNEIQLGAIAEEVNEFCPILVGYRFTEEGEKIPDFLKYDRLPLIIVPVLRDTLSEIDSLKKRMEVLEYGR